MSVIAPTLDLDAGARVAPVPPPLYYAAAFAAGMALDARGIHVRFNTGTATVVGGVALVAAGVGLAVAGVVQVRRARTTIVPHRPVTALLTRGAYRFSRNPMYTGLAIAYLGCTAFAGSWLTC